MKNKVLAMMLVTALGLAGCVNTPEPEKKPEAGATQNEEVQPEKEPEKEPEKVVLAVYYPNDNADGTDKEDVEVEKVTEAVIWKLLQDKGVLSSEAAYNEFKKDNTTLELDVNEGFGNQLRSYGTSGETVMLQSVVNTFLEAYQCEQMKITENGEVLCSGHAEYTDYFTVTK